MKRKTYYDVLGVSSDAAEDEIVAAFRTKVKQWHPDVSRHPDAEERMREINRAAAVLCDPERRKQYDRALAGLQPFPKSTAPGPEGDGQSGAPRRTARARGRGGAAPPLFSRKSLRAAVIGGAVLGTICILTVAVFLALPARTGPGTPATQAGGGGAAVPPSLPEEPLPAREAGDALLAEGDARGALAAYDAVLAENPGITDRDFWYNRGVAQNALGRHLEAADAFDRVLSFTPQDPLALAQMGASLIGMGRYEESLRYTDRALTVDPELAWIWANRGIALECMGELSEARLAYENAGILSGRIDLAAFRTIVAGNRAAAGF